MLYEIFIPRLFTQGYYFFAIHRKPKFKYFYHRNGGFYGGWVRILWFDFGVSCIPF
jgi:hypothetical protein